MVTDDVHTAFAKTKHTYNNANNITKKTYKSYLYVVEINLTAFESGWFTNLRPLPVTRLYLRRSTKVHSPRRGEHLSP